MSKNLENVFVCVGANERMINFLEFHLIIVVGVCVEGKKIGAFWN